MEFLSFAGLLFLVVLWCIWNSNLLRIITHRFLFFGWVIIHPWCSAGTCSSSKMCGCKLSSEESRMPFAGRLLCLRIATSLLHALGSDFLVPGMMPRYIWCLLCLMFIQLMSLSVCSVEHMDGAVCMQTCKKNSGSQDSTMMHSKQITNCSLMAQF